MKKNIGMLDKTLRTLVALAFIIMYFTNVVTGTLGIIFLIFAIIFLATSLFSACPLYMPFKISTSKQDNKG